VEGKVEKLFTQKRTLLLNPPNHQPSPPDFSLKTTQEAQLIKTNMVHPWSGL
jgi:hypothetical protein